MTPSDVKLMIEAVGVPSAYYQFSARTKVKPPFICFFYEGGSDELADDKNYTRIEQLYIELYSDTKDFALERAVEDALSEHGLVYRRESTYLDSERMHETIYTTEILMEVENA